MIAEVLRIYRGEEIQEIIKIIRRKLNINYKRSTGLSPFEALNKYSFFDLSDGQLKNNEKIDFKIEKEEDCTKKRYLLNDTVYVRRHNATKLEDQYEGPYVVTEIGKKGLWVKINNEDSWIHVRHLAYPGRMRPALRKPSIMLPPTVLPVCLLLKRRFLLLKDIY